MAATEPTYKNLLAELYALAPRGMELGLGRIQRAANALGLLACPMRRVQITGTNGKGTTSALLAHAATTAGVKTGLFTSPHLHRFAERIRLDDEEAPPELLVPVFERVLALTKGEHRIPLTFFEAATLAGLLAFEMAGVELAVLEVGLGGRLDATSIAPPELTAITSIGFDHMVFLGHTLASIAREKAAIARPLAPLVVGRMPDDALAVITAVAERIGAELRLLGRDFHVDTALELPFPGRHQRENAAIAAELYRLLAKTEPRLAASAFADAAKSVRWPGRFEVLDGSPRFVLDGAHNLEAAVGLVEQLAERGVRPDVLVFGALKDKPAAAMLDTLRPVVGRVVLTLPPVHRALDPWEIAERTDIVTADVDIALDKARALAGEHGTVLVTGSFYVVGRARELLLKELADPPVEL